MKNLGTLFIIWSMCAALNVTFMINSRRKLFAHHLVIATVTPMFSLVILAYAIDDFKSKCILNCE